MVLLSVVLLLSSCGDDYKESGIEGQWQLQTIETAKGKSVKVDTVFYSFKKDVFRYLRLKTNTQTFTCFGNYSVSDEKLEINVNRDSFEPNDDTAGLDWDTLIRTFTIKKHSSSTLELEFEGDTYYFRKY